MKCPNCGGNNIQIQAVNESILKNKHHSIIWWLLIGWWWVFLKWLVFTVPALFIKIFGLGHKRQKIVNKTARKYVCQNCGHIWQ